MKTPFHFLIFKVFHAQRNKIRQNMDAYGLYPGQPKVLRYISNHRDCKLKDIAQECDVECATVSKLLNNLEDMGMLTRMVDQKNKRALQLNINIVMNGSKLFYSMKFHIFHDCFCHDHTIKTSVFLNNRYIMQIMFHFLSF